MGRWRLSSWAATLTTLTSTTLTLEVLTALTPPPWLRPSCSCPREIRSRPSLAVWQRLCAQELRLTSSRLRPGRSSTTSSTVFTKRLPSITLTNRRTVSAEKPTKKPTKQENKNSRTQEHLLGNSGASTPAPRLWL